jgi:hypothetical protein
MRWILLVGLLAGCQQIFGLHDPQQVVGDARPSLDVRPIDASMDASGFAACSNDSNLVACYDFEGNVNDGAPAANATTASNVSFPPGRLGKAIGLASASRVTIADSTQLDVSAVTLEAWIYPTQLPASTGRAGIIDVDGQYAMFLYASSVACIGNGSLQYSQMVGIGTWTHIACTSSGNTMNLYINGVLATTGMGGLLSTSPTAGGEIGGNAPDGLDRFTGSIDLLRIYRVERTAAQISVDAAP